MTKKRKSLEDYLVEEIKKSGYPLEIEISSLLDKDYLVFNTQYYFDEETQQGRDIDIYAIPRFNVGIFIDEEFWHRKLSPFDLRNEIAIECKKSETHAWILYTRPLLQPASRIFTGGQYATTVPRPQEKPLSIDSLLFSKLTLHYDKFNNVAVAYDEIKKRSAYKKSRREIFEGVTQLVKFVCHEMRSIKAQDLGAMRRHSHKIAFLFPIIVYDGDIFEVTFPAGEPKLERRTHLLLSTHYRSPYLKQVESFLIDIVHRSFFPELMRMLKTDFERIRDAVIQNRDELAKIAEECQALREKEGFFF